MVFQYDRENEYFWNKMLQVAQPVAFHLLERRWPLCVVHLQTVQAELDARRADWAVGLDQLAQYTDSLEKELIKMAGNMRRSRTEILQLSVRWVHSGCLIWLDGRNLWISGTTAGGIRFRVILLDESVSCRRSQNYNFFSTDFTTNYSKCRLIF